MPGPIERIAVGRIVVLALLVLAAVGPWIYDGDGVPPPEWCAAPNVLLQNGHCARLVPGTEFASFVGWIWIALAMGPLTGASVVTARQLLSMLLFLAPVLPFVTTALLLPRRWRRSRRLLACHMAACGLAAAALLALILPLAPADSVRLWGAWLYTAAAGAGLALELLAWATARRAARRPVDSAARREAFS